MAIKNIRDCYETVVILDARREEEGLLNYVACPVPINPKRWKLGDRIRVSLKRIGPGHYESDATIVESDRILTEEQSQLAKVGHCPWDVESEDESDALPEPHCHANRDGECTFAYCPQPVIRYTNIRQMLSKMKGSERDESSR